MKLEVSVEKRYVILLIGVILLVGGGIFVYAALSDPAPTPVGHTSSEMAGFPDCTSGEALSYNSASSPKWNCVSAGGGGGPVSFKPEEVKVLNTVYQAPTAGIVTAFISVSTSFSQTVFLAGSVGATNPPATVVARDFEATSLNGPLLSASITFPVGQGEWWQVTGSGPAGVTSRVAWRPFA